MELLPEEVTMDILSRLPVKTIIYCKSVCKKWRNLVSSSYFVNLHLSRSPTGFIIHHDSDKNMAGYASEDPGILKWVEVEDEVDLHHDPVMSLHLNLAPILQNSGILQTGSVNGLICLWQYSYKIDNTYICNPITREYMILPSQQQCCYTEGEGSGSIVYGFGVSSLTGEYKVVRKFERDIPPNACKSSGPSVSEAEVYTLGTGQWRSLGRVPYWLYEFCGLFLNNHIHWHVHDEDASEKLCTFDLDNETFQLFPSPPSETIQESRFHYQSLAVLRGCLCKLDTYDSQCTIWVMKEYGIKKSWHKEVVITQESGIDLEKPMWEPLSLIEGLKDGSILIVCEYKFEYKLCIFYPQSQTLEDTKMFDSVVSGLTYRPSFLKLQNFESEKVHIF